MSGSTRKGERNKNDTWGEKNLSKYISGSAAGKQSKVKPAAESQPAQRKQKSTGDAYGSYGSSMTQTKRKPGTSASSSGSHLLKQSSSSSSPSPSPLAGRKQAGTSSGTSKRTHTTFDEKSHRSSSDKTTTRVGGQQVPRSSAGAGASGGSGHGRDKGETQRPGKGGDESSTKRSSRGDGKERQKGVRDSRDSVPKASSRSRDKDHHQQQHQSKDTELKSERSRDSRNSRGHGAGAEGRGHHQLSERSKERRREEGRGSEKTRERGGSEKRHKDRVGRSEEQRGREGSHGRSSGSRDRERGRERERREEKKIVMREDPPPVPEEEDVEGGGGGAEGRGLEEGNPPQQMVEVTEEVGGDEYQYEDDEFEDYEYEEDFDEVPEEEDEDNESDGDRGEQMASSRSLSEDEGISATPTKHRGNHHTSTTTHQPIDKVNQVKDQSVDLLAIMKAIDAENTAVEPIALQTDITEPSFGTIDDAVVIKFTSGDSESDGEKEGEGIAGGAAEGGTKFESEGGFGGKLLQSPSRKFVDFSHAQRSEASLKVAKKTKKRAQELLSMIELDIVSHDMFDLPPLSEYELYVKKFGADDTRQVSSQTGEDNQESDAQTEPITTEERWVQWPPEDLKGWGKGGDPGHYEEGEEEVGGVSFRRMEGEGALRLISFLKKAGQVCSVLLEENLAAVGQSQFQSTQSQFPFCTSVQRIQAVPSFLSGRYVQWVDFSSTQDHLFLSAYSLPPSSSKTADSGIRGKGLVCLWNTRDPLQPQMVLSCESCPSCCCFSPQKSSLAFAGNEDGSVVLWDLREPLSMHRPSQLTTPLSPRAHGTSTVTEALARVPTFSTAGIPQTDNHRAPIVSITPISTASGGTVTGGHVEGGGEIQETSSGLSFQLATLDRSGHLNLWVVVEVANPDPYGSEADLGLVPGGRVKLVKSTSTDVTSQPTRRGTERSFASLSPSIRVFCMEFHPRDSSHLYVGTDTGQVHHITRYGRRPIPRFHTTTTENEGAVCDVLCMSFSHRQPDHFLAGCSNGSLRLYHTKSAKPLLAWNTFAPYGAAVVHVEWVESCPGLFLVQDSLNTIYMWDLMHNDSEPMFKETQTSRITCCRLHRQSHTHKSSPAPPILLLAYADCSVAIHQFKELTQDISERELMFENYLTELA